MYKEGSVDEADALSQLGAYLLCFLGSVICFFEKTNFAPSVEVDLSYRLRRADLC